MKRTWVLGLAIFAALAVACGDEPGGTTPPEQPGTETPDASTPDATVPVTPQLELVTVVPARGATAVAVTTQVTLTFSAPLKQASVTPDSVLLYPSVGTPEQKRPATLTVSADAKTVTLAPSAELEGKTAYTVLVRGGASGVASATGLLLAADVTTGFLTAEKIPTTTDTTPPTVVSVDPRDNATDVPLDSKVTVRFSESVDPATVTAQNIEVVEWWDGNPQGEPLTGTFDTSGGSTVVFTPSANFGVGDEYKVTVRTGVKDLAGNSLASSFTSGFTAAWVQPGNEPRVERTWPADAATGAATGSAIQIVFNKRMRQTTVSPNVVLERASGGGAVTLRQDASGNPSFVFYPQAALAANTSYKLTVKSGSAGALDEGSNPMTADFVARFTTGSGADTTPLEIVSMAPASAATGVSHTTTVALTFNKPVDPAKLFLSYTGTTGTLLVSKYADYTFPVAGAIDFTDNPTVRFNIDPTTTYELERTYHVKVAATVKALSGAAMAADYKSTFTTKGPDQLDASIADLRAVNGTCAIRVKGVTMTFMRDQPNNWKGFFIQKEKTGPAIFVVTGDRKPLFPIYPDSTASGYPNIDITVTKVGDNNGFKQVLAFTMTRNTTATKDLAWVRQNLVQVIGDTAVGADFESEYVQIDGVLANYRPGGSAENREFDLTWGTGRKLTMKISQFGIQEPLGLKAGSKVRVLAPLQRDDKGFFIKPYGYWDNVTMTRAQLDDPANYDYMLDIVKLAD